MLRGSTFQEVTEEQRFVGRDDGRLVDLESGLRQPLHARAGGDHDGLGGGVDVVTYLDLAAGLERPRPRDDRDLVLLHQELDALRVLLGDLAGALHRHAVVERHVARGDAERLGVVANQVRDPGRVQQRLARDAADVHTDAAELLPLDHGDIL